MDWDLIADIGGTHIRVASLIDGEIRHVQSFASKGKTALIDVLAGYIGGFANQPRRASLAIAGLIEPDRARLTNARQEIRMADINALCKDGARFINDFEAAGWALATVKSSDVSVISAQTGNDISYGTRVICGVGTGLGVGALIDASMGGASGGASRWCAISGEGGHRALTPHNEHDVAVFTALCKLWPEVRFHNRALCVEAEAVLSGTGIPVLYRAICKVSGDGAVLRTAPEILTAAQAGTDENAVALARIFRTHLAVVCGDLAVTFKAQGGVFLCGGVLEHNAWLFNRDFIDMFHAGGRFTGLRQSCPLYHYRNPQLGLIGAANLTMND